MSASCIRSLIKSADMDITIHFYSYFKDLTGCARTTVAVLPGGTIGDLLKQLIARFPNLGAIGNVPIFEATILVIVVVGAIYYLVAQRGKVDQVVRAA